MSRFLMILGLALISGGAARAEDKPIELLPALQVIFHDSGAEPQAERQIRAAIGRHVAKGNLERVVLIDSPFDNAGFDGCVQVNWRDPSVIAEVRKSLQEVRPAAESTVYRLIQVASCR